MSKYQCEFMSCNRRTSLYCTSLYCIKFCSILVPSSNVLSNYMDYHAPSFFSTYLCSFLPCDLQQNASICLLFPMFWLLFSNNVKKMANKHFMNILCIKSLSLKVRQTTLTCYIEF